MSEGRVALILGDNEFTLFKIGGNRYRCLHQESNAIGDVTFTPEDAFISMSQQSEFYLLVSDLALMGQKTDERLVEVSINDELKAVFATYEIK